VLRRSLTAVSIRKGFPKERKKANAKTYNFSVIIKFKDGLSVIDVQITNPDEYNDIRFSFVWAEIS